MRALNYRVFLRFVGHGIAPNRKHLHIITTAQRLTHRILGIAEQARTHVAVGRQAQAVALAAEVARERADEAHRARGAGEMIVLCGTPADWLVLPRRNELAQTLRASALVDDVEHFLAGDDAVLAPADTVDLGDIADGHVLDEAHVQRAVDRELGEIEEAVRKRAECDRIDFHGVESRLERRIDAAKRVVERAATRNLVELLGVERVER